MSSYRNTRGGVSKLGKDNKGFFSKILRNVSNWGMDTDQMMKNSHAVGINQTPTPVDGSADMMYDVMSQNAVAKLFQNKASAYLDRSYPKK